MKKLELVTNTTLLVTCVVLVALVLTRDRDDARAARIPIPFDIGDHFGDIPGIDNDPGKASLVLFETASCPYCTTSMPFYKRLADAISAPGSRVRFVALSSDTVAKSEEYLASHNITVSAVARVEPGFRGVLSTPTLILLDSANRVRGAWVGLLDSEQEGEVLEAIEKLNQ